MASFLLTRLLPQSSQPGLSRDVPLTPKEALSGIWGSISLVSWIFVFIPQLLENYHQQSAESVSLLFIFIWFVGDATNLIGAVWAGLVPTVIAIAVYFCFADFVIGIQCMYYNIKNRRKERLRTISTDTSQAEATEDQPLLNRRDSSNSIGLPGSHRSRRRSSNLSKSAQNQDNAHGTLAKIAEEDALRNETNSKREWIKNIVSIVLICGLGTGSWAIAWKIGAWKPTPAPEDVPDNGDGMPIGAEIFGYISAFLYLAARIPQIIRNWREQSCEGLSLLFFMLSLLGNLSYGAGILFHSLQKDYILTNLPWLIGSLGTMFEDITIFVQFKIYGESKTAEVENSVAVE